MTNIWLDFFLFKIFIFHKKIHISSISKKEKTQNLQRQLTK
jgi:hypothetical protein